ncbi:MAG: recombinase family protein [Sphingobacteriales bacterium JAD_PAG50586_3]|nr:MAG: recombinase family protein [Sphingobacteriales bacterium JAD_PAG50586_3]
MKKCFSYTRVSTKEQGDGVSLQEQVSFNESYAKTHDLTIVEVFEDKQTARKVGRKAFNEMLKRLKSGEAEGAIFYKIDRVARNRQDWADINKLMDAGIECHFAQEALNLSSPAGRLGADIMNAFATHYSVNLSSEITKG